MRRLPLRLAAPVMIQPERKHDSLLCMMLLHFTTAGLYHRWTFSKDLVTLGRAVADIIASGPVQGACHAVITVGCLWLCFGKRRGEGRAGKRPARAS